VGGAGGLLVRRVNRNGVFPVLRNWQTATDENATQTQTQYTKMKQTLTTQQAADILFADKNAGWTYAGARALVEYLEELEEDTGEEMELDFVAIRCDFSESPSLQEWASDYFGEPLAQWADRIGVEATADDDELDSAIREYIQDRGQLIEFDGGVIVSSF
jgi:hypothetical protein